MYLEIPWKWQVLHVSHNFVKNMNMSFGTLFSALSWKQNPSEADIIIVEYYPSKVDYHPNKADYHPSKANVRNLKLQLGLTGD